MRPKLTKRACDGCISRKVKCSGAKPCETCQFAPARVDCTYLRPARRRGPKVRRLSGRQARSRRSRESNSAGSVGEEHQSENNDVPQEASSSFDDRAIPATVLAAVVRMYQTSSYSVWPVIDADVLLQKLEVENEVDSYCLATALCAATMAQLQLAPLENGDQVVDSSLMAAECMKVREKRNYRENITLQSVFVSFFLHVYHAKINQRNSAMMFIQEAISAARLLKLDDGMQRQDCGVIVNEEIVFILLWVSERGYAMHLGLTPSYTHSIRIPDVTGNIHVQGLLELARLFAAFDEVSVRRHRATGVSADSLEETEAALSRLSFSHANRASSRLADYCITKEWMRTIIWQEGLSRRLLSSNSSAELMTFRFPARVSRDLLSSLQGFSESDLLPLGRDQLLKCFEVANSLADTVLLTPASHLTLQLGPQDFLHALYQKLLPFLEQDTMLKSILRAKTADALVMAPARLLSFGCSNWFDAEDETNIEEYLDASAPYDIS